MMNSRPTPAGRVAPVLVLLAAEEAVVLLLPAEKFFHCVVTPRHDMRLALPGLSLV